MTHSRIAQFCLSPPRPACQSFYVVSCLSRFDATDMDYKARRVAVHPAYIYPFFLPSSLITCPQSPLERSL